MPNSATTHEIICLAQYPFTWYSFESVYEAMQQDPRFRCHIVTIKSLYPPSGLLTPIDKISGFLRERGIPFIDGDSCDLRDLRPDVLFVPGPFDHSKETPYYIRTLAEIAPLAYIPYGFEIGGGHYLKQQFNFDLHNLAWRVFSRSERHKAMYRKHCRRGDAHVVVTGHPKIDAYFKSVDEERIYARFGIPQGRYEKIILWNPHFQVEKDGRSISTFPQYAEFIFNLSREYPQHLFVFRPHPALRQRLSFLGVMDEAGWDRFISDLQQRCPNVLYSDQYEYFELFRITDALISDVSSFLFEFIPTRKPVLYTHNSQGPALNDDGDIVNYYYQAQLTADIRTFVEMVSADQDPMQEMREQNLGQFLYQPDGKAGERIVAHLASVLT